MYHQCPWCIMSSTVICPHVRHRMPLIWFLYIGLYVPHACFSARSAEGRLRFGLQHHQVVEELSPRAVKVAHKERRAGSPPRGLRTARFTKATDTLQTPTASRE